MASLSSSTHTRVSHRFALAAAIIGVAAVATAVLFDSRRVPIRAQTLRYEMSAPDNEVAFQFAVSPDGQRVAFTTHPLLTLGKHRRIWIRRLDALQAQPVEGTDGASEFSGRLTAVDRILCGRSNPRSAQEGRLLGALL